MTSNFASGLAFLAGSDTAGDGMGRATIGLLVLYAAGMAGGQILFKIAALRATGAPALIPALILNPPFWLAIALYGGLTVLWVWLLTRIPLAYAYPFMMLAFVFTPVLSALLLGERLSWGYALGALLIVGGLGVITATASG